MYREPLITLTDLYFEIMEKIVTFQPPIDNKDIPRIEAILKNRKVIVAAKPEFPPLHSFMTYMSAIFIDGINIIALIDRNILSALVAIAKGDVININDPTYQSISALMCFLLSFDIQIEPAIALYEYGSFHSHSKAVSDLRYFRVADHLHPKQYADIALGRRNRASDEEIELAETFADKFALDEENSFARLLRPFKINYLYALKIANLARMSLQPMERLQQFYMWMLNETVISAVATSFATIYFGPHDKRPLIKRINSRYSDKLLDGIKNATWDMCYLSHWGKMVTSSDSNKANLLCSCDTDLLDVAECLFFNNSVTVTETAIERVFLKHWPPNLMKQLIEQRSQLHESVRKNPKKRELHIKESWGRLDQMILREEAALGVQSNLLQVNKS